MIFFKEQKRGGKFTNRMKMAFPCVSDDSCSSNFIFGRKWEEPLNAYSWILMSTDFTGHLATFIAHKEDTAKSTESGIENHCSN